MKKPTNDELWGSSNKFTEAESQGDYLSFTKMLQDVDPDQSMGNPKWRVMVGNDEFLDGPVWYVGTTANPWELGPFNNEQTAITIMTKMNVPRESEDPYVPLSDRPTKKFAGESVRHNDEWEAGYAAGYDLSDRRAMAFKWREYADSHPELSKLDPESRERKDRVRAYEEGWLAGHHAIIDPMSDREKRAIGLGYAERPTKKFAMSVDGYRHAGEYAGAKYSNLDEGDRKEFWLAELSGLQGTLPSEYAAYKIGFMAGLGVTEYVEYPWKAYSDDPYAAPFSDRPTKKFIGGVANWEAGWEAIQDKAEQLMFDLKAALDAFEASPSAVAEAAVNAVVEKLDRNTPDRIWVEWLGASAYVPSEAQWERHKNTLSERPTKKFAGPLEGLDEAPSGAARTSWEWDRGFDDWLAWIDNSAGAAWRKGIDERRWFELWDFGYMPDKAIEVAIERRGYSERPTKKFGVGPLGRGESGLYGPPWNWDPKEGYRIGYIWGSEARGSNAQAALNAYNKGGTLGPPFKEGFIEGFEKGWAETGHRAVHDPKFGPEFPSLSERPTKKFNRIEDYSRKIARIIAHDVNSDAANYAGRPVESVIERARQMSASDFQIFDKDVFLDEFRREYERLGAGSGMGLGELFAEVDDEDYIELDAPPGKEKQVRALKKDKDVDNPYAVAWAEYNKNHSDTMTVTL